MDFVSGDLLDYEIKPLELCAPKFEERLKEDCEECESCCSPVVTQEPETDSEPAEPEADA